jgi:Cu/Ag efflux protein CusF
MKTFLSLFLVLTACLTTAWCAADSDTPTTHPLKGVVMGILPEKTALLVKHEEVPGVMRAMTMMFKVEPAVLEKVKRGDAITARMSRRDDGWWLTEVEVVPATTPAR